MSHSEALVPNFPPPPIFNTIPSHSSLNLTEIPIPSSTQAIDPNRYKNRLQNFLEIRQNQKASDQQQHQPQKAIKLNEVAREMSYCFDMIEMIKTEIDTLSQTASSMPASQWDEQMFQLNSKTADLSAICSKYQDLNLINAVQNVAKKRQLKRDRIRLRKAETKEFRKYQAINRERKHHEIDKWLEKNTEEILNNRRQIETKQRAEQILMNVKSRKSEAEKQILVLNSLKELNRIRNRDKHTVANDTEFNREIDDIKEMWLTAYKNYECEEKGLLAFLNCTNRWEEWRDTIFGEPKKEYAVFSLKKKDKGLIQLIKIRNLWDECIVPDDNPFGSCIPLGWVFPNTNPSDKWKQYIETNN